jgi:hypothetical protein
VKTMTDIDELLADLNPDELVDALRACTARVLSLAPHLTLAPSLSGTMIACRHCAEQVPQPLGEIDEVCLLMAGITLRHRHCHAGMARSRKAPAQIPDDFEHWIASPMTGASSATLFRALSGLPTPQYRHDAVPHDVWDLLRCSHLLDLQEAALARQVATGVMISGVGATAWRSRLPEIGRAKPAWSGLVAVWEALETAARQAGAGTLSKADTMALNERIRVLTTPASDGTTP